MSISNPMAQLQSISSALEGKYVSFSEEGIESSDSKPQKKLNDIYARISEIIKHIDFTQIQDNTTARECSGLLSKIKKQTETRHCEYLNKMDSIWTLRGLRRFLSHQLV